MAKRVDIRESDNFRDAVLEAAQALSRGELVALPTETVYSVFGSALQPDAVVKLQRLRASSGRDACVLVVKGPQEALDYVDALPDLGRKMIRRCWPGPVIVSFQRTAPTGLLAGLPAETHAAVLDDGELRIRVPAHDFVQELLRLIPAPLVMLAEAPQSLCRAEDVENSFGGELALLIDDGPCRYCEPCTMIRVAGREWQLVQPGVVTETMIGRLASEVILFVCTGNTCRSPMAEGVFRKILAQELQCHEDELMDRGFVVASAGMAAASGVPASGEAVELCRQEGIDLSSHASQPLTDRLLDQADRVYTMTAGHRDTILAARPDSAGRVQLLSREGLDIVDPIGSGLPVYEQCLRQLQRSVRSIVQELNIG